MKLSSKRKPGAVILISPFTSVSEIAFHLVGKVSSLLKDRFNNREIASLVTSPTLIIHGKLDQLIPYQQSEELSNIMTKVETIKCIYPDQMDHNKMNIYELRLFIKDFLEELKMIEINKNLENFYRIDSI